MVRWWPIRKLRWQWTLIAASFLLAMTDWEFVRVAKYEDGLFLWW